MRICTDLLKVIILVKVVAAQTDFKSAPTTVKAPENDTVLLPCYMETVSNGEFAFLGCSKFGTIDCVVFK